MIKKYIALNLITASFAVVGCSGGDVDAFEGGDVLNDADSSEATPGIGGSVYYHRRT